MKSNDRLETEKLKKIHYFLIGNDFNKVLKTLDKRLHFYRFLNEGKFKGDEIIYDVPSNMLSNAGLVLSKQNEEDKTYFKVRKISTLPGGYKRPSQKFSLGECEGTEEPKDFPIQISNAISNSFSNAFTIDLVSVVRQTVPKIQIIVTGQKYKIISGDGFEAYMLYEKAIYKDIATKKKVKRYGVTFKLPKDEKWDKWNNEILQAVEHYCKEMVSYESSRFEIAQRLLYPKPYVEEKKEEVEE